MATTMLLSRFLFIALCSPPLAISATAIAAVPEEGAPLEADMMSLPPTIEMPAEDISKVSIKDVMITVYKEKLANKVIAGEASYEEKERLLVLYEVLADRKPPRGNLQHWQRRTSALVKAAQAAVDGRDEAPNLLKKSMECGACHTSHK